MKKKSILLMLALAGLFVSCNDAIDIEQPGERNNPYEVFKNSHDIKRGVSGIYALIPAESEIAFASIFTDEAAIGRGNGGQGLISGEYGFLMQPGTAFAISTWSSYYSMINRINQLLESTDSLIANQTELAELTKLKGQRANLLGLRAYANLKLFSYYTPDYTNPSGLSIMKADFVPVKGSLNEHVGRSTVSVIRKFILDDIDEAIELGSTANSWGFFEKDDIANAYLSVKVLNGLKVKLYSMTGEYDLLEPIALSLLNSGENKLANASEYVDMFAFDSQMTFDSPVTEVMFGLNRPVGGSGADVASAWYSSRVNAQGGFFYEMGRSLYNVFDVLDPAQTNQPFSATRTDVRYQVNLAAGTEVDVNYQSLTQLQYVQNDILLIGKFKGKTGAFPASLRADIPIMRISDIALLLAEARAAQGAIAMTSSDPNNLEGDYSTVGNIIANIRLFRTADPTFNTVNVPTITSVQSAWKAILDERRVEFAYEGHRYLDMKRLGVKAGSPGFQRYAKDCIVNGTCAGLPPTSHKLTLPIPVSEINANPIIRNQQNPGY